MQRVEVNAPIHVRSPEEQLDFYRTVIMALALKAGGTITIAQNDWPDAGLRFSVIDQMAIDPATKDQVIEISVQREA